MSSDVIHEPVRRLRGPARREQLLDTAAAFVAERGFADVTIEAVSQAAGVSRPIIYGHFGDLQTLLTAVIERETARARDQVAATEVADLSRGEPRDLLIDSLRAYLHAVAAHPVTWRLVLMPPENAPGLLRRLISDGRATALSRLTLAVRPMLAGPDSPDAELTARMFSAMADEYARLVLLDPQRFPPERLLDHARRYLGGTPL